MATSSIFHNFVIEGEENVKRFIDAFDESLEATDPTIEYTGRVITDHREAQELIAKQYMALMAKEAEAGTNAL